MGHGKLRNRLLLFGGRLLSDLFPSLLSELFLGLPQMLVHLSSHSVGLAFVLLLQCLHTLRMPSFEVGPDFFHVLLHRLALFVRCRLCD